MAAWKGFFAGILLVALAGGQTLGAPLIVPRELSEPLKPQSRPPANQSAKKSAAKKAAAIPAAEPGPAPPQVKPPVPLRPSQMPAVPPRVSYQNGMLTIVAENSTMADVIAQVRSATGVKIETVGGPSGERIAARIGPAPVREVILSLVQGSQYDFIILGALNDPQAVERVILTPKVGGSVSASAQPPRSTQPNQPIYQAPPMETSDDDGNEGFAAPAPQPQATPGQPGQPNDPNAPAKTPEQLLEELRRMEEQRNNPQGRPQRPPRDN
jgi:hypothetical protein